MNVKKITYEHINKYHVVFGIEEFIINEYLKPRNIIPYDPKKHKQVILVKKDKKFKPSFIFSSNWYQIACFDTVKEAKKYFKNREYL